MCTTTSQCTASAFFVYLCIHTNCLLMDSSCQQFDNLMVLYPKSAEEWCIAYHLSCAYTSAQTERYVCLARGLESGSSGASLLVTQTSMTLLSVRPDNPHRCTGTHHPGHSRGRLHEPSCGRGLVMPPCRPGTSVSCSLFLVVCLGDETAIFFTKMAMKETTSLSRPVVTDVSNMQSHCRCKDSCWFASYCVCRQLTLTVVWLCG